MRKKYIIIVITFIISVLLVSCDNKESVISNNNTDENNKQVEENVIDNNEENNKEKQADADENSVNNSQNNDGEEDNTKEKELCDMTDEELAEKNKARSLLDGKIYDKEELDKRVVAVSIDNHPKARKQAGLSEAEIVYEVEVEFPYTRYIAVFQTSEPKLIGPVRSARPYMIYISSEYDSLFTHVGGSPDAFAKLSSLNIADIDGLYTSALWRYNNTNKYMPHNVYTTLKSLRNFAKNKNYRNTSNFTGYAFNSSDTDLDELEELDDANNVKITYNKFNNTSYVYDSENKNYTRYKDGIEDLDENDNAQITAKNIIIYKVDRKVLDNKGRLYFGVVGKGTGYYITNGKYIKISWKKESEKAKTKFYVGDKELEFNPGNTWIHIANKKAKINISK